MKEMMKEFRFMWRLLVVIALASDSGERDPSVRRYYKLASQLEGKQQQQQRLSK